MVSFRVCLLCWAACLGLLVSGSTVFFFFMPKLTGLFGGPGLLTHMPRGKQCLFLVLCLLPLVKMPEGRWASQLLTLLCIFISQTQFCVPFCILILDHSDELLPSLSIQRSLVSA